MRNSASSASAGRNGASDGSDRSGTVGRGCRGAGVQGSNGPEGQQSAMRHSRGFRSSVVAIWIPALAVVATDQATKAWARQWLSHRTITILPRYLELRTSYNTGAAFGILRGARWLLLVLAIPVGVGLVIWARRSVRLGKLAAGLAVGGIAGNSIDRLFQPDGRVTDFIAPSFWPAFNVADSAMVVGTLLLALCMFESSGAGRSQAEARDARGSGSLSETDGAVDP